MAKIDFEGKTFNTLKKPLVKDDLYPVTCVEIDDKLMKYVGKDKKEKIRLILRWALPNGEKIAQFTSTDVKIGVGKYSPTSSYTFLEKAGELETFKMFVNGKEEIENEEVLHFFKQAFLGRKAKILTKTITSTDGTKYSVIDRFVEIMPKV